MTDPVPQTRLEKTVGILTRAAVSLWVGGFVLLLVNSFTLDKDKLATTAVQAILSGFVVALVILLLIVGSVVAKKLRKDS